MSTSDWLIGSVALGVSLLIHGLLFFNTGSTTGNDERLIAERKVTRVSFRSVAAPPTSQPLQQEVAETAPEPEVKESSAPLPEPVVPKPEKRSERARQPEPAPTAPREPSAPSPVPTVAQAEKSAVDVEQVAGTVMDPALIERAKQEYLRRLMAHIEAHKKYPRAARRRRIEGDVKVRFSLQADGGIAALETGGGHRLLADAARQAVMHAAPMPHPPENLVLPWEVRFTMRFSLH